MDTPDMQAIHLENGALSLRMVKKPTVKDGFALIKMRLAGICATDRELVQGYYPFKGILGHEFIGEVAQGAERWLGKRVVANINIACGSCTVCQHGISHHCPQRKVIGIKDYDGTFAEYLLIPESNLYAVPEEISDEQAVFAEPLAAALQIQSQITLKKMDQVLIIGAGKLGQLIAQTIQRSHSNVCVTARSEAKFHPLRKLGISCLANNDVEFSAYDYVVECSGNPAGLQLAINAAKAGGCIVLKSTYAHSDKHQLNLTKIVVNEITLIGSRCGDMQLALDHLRQSYLELNDLITGIFPLTKALNAFELSQQPSSLKVLLRGSNCF